MTRVNIELEDSLHAYYKKRAIDEKKELQELLPEVLEAEKKIDEERTRKATIESLRNEV